MMSGQSSSGRVSISPLRRCQAERSGSRCDGHFSPAAMVKTLAVIGLFSGLRRNEIARLRIGCVRWQEGEEKSGSQLVCFLHVPVNETGTALSKPVDGVVGRAVEL